MEAYCRGCLEEFEPTELLQYSESNRRLFVYCTGLQVKRNDAFPFQLCKECFIYLKIACKFKKKCRSSDKKFKTYLGLKNAGETVDFPTYMKGVEDNFTLKIPSANRVSTPMYHKNDDDDNESTCTSIQNFMTDIRETLQEEDMLTTEDKLIREVIQEEADISDDSLDSHWLDDENVNDFAMDFHFPAVGTPSSNENCCSTPVRVTTDEESSCHFIHKDVILKSDKTITVENRKDRGNATDVNIMNQSSDEFSDNNFKECDRLAKSSIQNDMPLIDDCDMAIDGIINSTASMSELDSAFPIASVEKLNDEPVVSHKELTMKQVSHSSITFTDELQHYSNINVTKSSDDNVIEDHTSNFNNLNSILNNNSAIITANHMDGNSISNQLFSLDIDQYINNSKQKHEKIIATEETEVENELEQYISKVKSKIKQNKIANEKCSIDRNLELALKNNGNEIFSLEQLLGSAHVSVQHSGGSTPLVHNVLFGSITPMHEHSTSQHIITDNSHNTDIMKSLSTNDKDVNDVIEVYQNESVQIFKKNIKNERNIANLKRKQIIDPNKSYKDIATLIELTYEKAEILNSSSETDKAKGIDRKRKIDDEISEDVHVPTKNKIFYEDDEDKITKTTFTDDLDISITNLLDFDENQSVDLNISIASDCLEEEQKKSFCDNDIFKIDNDECKVKLGELEFDEFAKKKDDDRISENNVLEHSEEVFKKPLLLADDDKYDLSKRKCKICDKRYRTAKALKLHFVKIHRLMLPKIKSKTDTRVCEICGKVLVDATSYSRHKKTHEVGQYKCQYCFARFLTQASVMQHIKSHANFHEDVEKPKEKPEKEKPEREQKKFLCILCDKEFKTIGNFNIHIRRHENNFEFKCEPCNKGFVRKYDFDQHNMITHYINLPFHCELCPEKFRDKYLLVNHMFMHMGIKKFECEHCGKHFHKRQHLKQHCRTCALNLIAREN